MMPFSSRIALTTALALLTTAAAGHVRAQGLPDTPAGRLIRALVDVLQDGDPERIRAFAAERVSLESRPVDKTDADVLMAIVEETGGVDLGGVRKAGPTSVVLQGRTRKTNARVAIELTLNQSNDRIVGIGLEVGGDAPEGGTSPPRARAASDEELGAALDAYVQTLMSEDRFSGVVLVAKDDEPIFEEAYGLASRRYGVPNRPDTRFSLGSLNKLFTKTAVLQLAHEGRLDLDAPISRYLPDFPAESAKRITVRHLANHTSGLGDIFTEEFARTSKDRLRSPRDYFPLFANEPLQFEPGTQQAYSNAGYIVLGAVIEAVAGKSYDAYVQERIYGPAGMKDTAAIAADDPVERVAEGYTRQGPDGPGQAAPDAPLRSIVFMVPYIGTPAGGGYSTAADLVRFVAALRAGTLLPAALAPNVLAMQVANAIPGAGGAAAAGPSAPAALPSVAFGGGGPGTSAHLALEGPYTIVVLSNLDPPSAPLVGRAATELLPAAR